MDKVDKEEQAAESVKRVKVGMLVCNLNAVVERENKVKLVGEERRVAVGVVKVGDENGVKVRVEENVE